MRKLYILLVILAVLSAGSSLAEVKAGYILKNPSNPVSGFVTAMQEMNISITYLDSDYINTYNLSQYDFLLVGNEQFSNAAAIPVNGYPTIIANSYHMNTWHWSNKVSQMVSTQPVQAVNNIPTHLITQGMPGIITIYTQCCFIYPPIGIPLFYLKSADRAQRIDSVVSTVLAAGDAGIGTIEPGEQLRDGVIATKKGVFFGAVHAPYWTPDSKQLFKNSITWLLADTTNPVISNVIVTNLAPTSATAEFDTDDPTTTTLYIKKNGLPFLTLYDFDPETEHSMPVTGLSPQTTYTFTITVCNSANYCTTSSTYSFTTPAVPDLTPPVMSNLVANAGTTSASVQFNTDDNSNATIKYGTTPSLGSNVDQTSFTTSHSISLAGLTDDTLYYYSIALCNPSGTCATYGTFTFTTQKIIDTTPPVISNIAVSNVTQSAATISYNTDDNANMTLKYGLTPSFGNTITNAGFTNQADQNIAGLSYNTTYYYQINACNIDGYCSTSTTNSFMTLPSDDTTPPTAPANFVIDVINADNGILLSWTASASNDTSGYRVYVADNPDNFNFSVPYATVTGTSFTDTSASSARQRFYIVRAFDAVGNEENNNNVLGKFDLELFAGFNLVSLPLTPLDSDLGEVMHQDASYNPVREVYSWTGTSFIKATFDVGEADYWDNNGINILAAGEGYFFNSLQAANFTILGTPITAAQNVALQTGLNLKGWSSLDERALGSVFSTDITEIARKNADGTFGIATYYTGGWFSADGFTTIEPGRGYWITAANNTTWVYNP